MRIYLIGFMGAGKSFWGKRLAQAIGYPFYDLDSAIEDSQGVSINELFSSLGEEGFRVVEKECLHLITESHADFVMACGGGTPCFLNNIEYLKRSGKVVWLHPPLAVLVRRLIEERAQRPLLKDIEPEALSGFIQKKMADRRLYYEQAHYRVELEQVDIPALIKIIEYA